jgi:hypothetical protein
MTPTPYVLDFSEISLADVPRVGGKNASLGEMFSDAQAPACRRPRRLCDDRRCLPASSEHEGSRGAAPLDVRSV